MVMNKTPATNIINNNNNSQMNGHQNGQLTNGKALDNYAQELRIEQYKASVFQSPIELVAYGIRHTAYVFKHPTPICARDVQSNSNGFH